MTVTYVDACNEALLKIGNAPLDTGDVTSDLYLWLTELYARATKQVLFDYSWGCQMGRKLLTQDTTDPVFGFLYRYQLPYDCLKVLGVYPSGCTYSIEGDYLLTDLDDSDYDPGLGVLYIKSLVAPSDPPAWVTTTLYEVGDFVLQSAKIYLCLTAHTSGTFATDLAALKWEETTYRKLDDVQPLLMEAITCKLAYLLTYKFTQSASWRRELVQEYQWILARAKQTDAMLGAVDGEEGSTEWVDAGRS